MMLEVAVEADGEWDSRIGWEALARKSAEAAIAESAFPQLAGSPRQVELSVRLAGDDEVRSMNAHWRGKDKPTNVLSFPSDMPTPPGEPRHLGDVALAFETVAREAAEEGKSVPDHVAHLVVHGILHLLGADHETDGEADAMEAREIEALARIGIADPYGRAAPQP